MLTVSLLICAMMALARADGGTLPPLTVHNGSSSDNPTIKSGDAQAPPAPSCSDGWSEFNGRCFRFIPTELSWAEAEKNCHSMKANLASVHSFEEYQHIQGMIQAVTQQTPNTWVGGSNCQQDNVWLWSDGSVFSYSFWCSDQPDNPNGNQRCLQINYEGRNCWDNNECAKTRPYICAMKL